MKLAAEVELMDPRSINIPDRMRQLNQVKVDGLAESIADIGIQTPIHYRLLYDIEINEHRYANAAFLVAGAHRIAAAIKLGLAEVPCLEVDCDDLEAQIWEIDENLYRSELSPVEEAAHLTRRRELWEAMKGGKTIPTPTAGGQQDVAFAANTAKAIGRTKRSINQKLARAENVVVLDDVKGTSLDKGVELDALAKLPEVEQRDLAERAKAGEQVSARKPVSPKDATNDFEAVTVQFNRLVIAWNAAGPDARQRFLRHIDRAVFHSTAAGQGAT